MKRRWGNGERDEGRIKVGTGPQGKSTNILGERHAAHRPAVGGED